MKTRPAQTRYRLKVEIDEAGKYVALFVAPPIEVDAQSYVGLSQYGRIVAHAAILTAGKASQKAGK